MKKIKLAVVGATGLVGRTVLKVLEEYNLPISEYTFKFPKESTLSYLNDKAIKLDDSFYLGKIEGTK